jgi:hypothetical protein
MTSGQAVVLASIITALWGGGTIAALIATFKRRSGPLWFVLGAIIPLLAIAVVAMLPVVERYE